MNTNETTISVSNEVAALHEAVAILESTRQSLCQGPAVIWRIVNNASEHISKQLHESLIS